MAVHSTSLPLLAGPSMKINLEISKRIRLDFKIQEVLVCTIPDPNSCACCEKKNEENRLIFFLSLAASKTKNTHTLYTDSQTVHIQ